VRAKAEPKLRALKDTTNMLVCAEDIGQMIDGILASLAREFDSAAAFP
jgi:hypothetical protein